MVASRFYSAFFSQCLLHLQRRCSIEIHWVNKWMNKFIHSSGMYNFSLLQLFYLLWTTTDEFALFSELYSYIAIQSFLVASKHLKSKGKALQPLCFHAWHIEELNLLLLIDCYCSVYYSFLIQQLTEKNWKRKPSQKSNNKITKCSFLKITHPQNTQGKSCVFSPLPLMRERYDFLSFHFVCVMSVLPGDLWLLFQKRSNDNGRWMVSLIKKWHSNASASSNSRRRGLFHS